MTNMKNRNLKKGEESIIGKIIYEFLLFMPLIAIFVTCGYAMFNKNAYQSQNLQPNYTQIKSNDDLVLNKTYHFSNVSPVNTYNITVSNISNLVGYSYNNLENINRIRLYSSGLVEFSQDTTQLFSTNNIINFDFNLISFYRENEVYKVLYNIENNTLLDTFYYSVEKVEQSNLFNWAQNSIIYTGIANTCTQLSITNTFIPLLLAYWLIISVIYILYDIILMLLIILHNKVHQLQDSLS